MLFVILFSICLSSFGGVVAWRLPQNMNFVNSRSICESCQTKLYWFHEIPIFSYLMLRGKCYFCRQKIAPQVFLIEMIGLLGGIVAACQSNINQYLLIILIITVATCAVTDYQQLAIFPITLAPCIISIILFNFPSKEKWLELSILAIVLGLIFALLHRRLGGGDIEIILMIALLLGLQVTLEVVLLASSTALIFLAICYFQGKKIKMVPFVPFILAGLLMRVSVMSVGPMLFDKFFTPASLF